MFVSFCLNYADVPADYFPREASSQDWIGELKYLNLYEKADEYTPAPGDLIFFDWERDGAADHVGLVEKVDNDTVYTIEGNNGKVVAEHRYALNAKEILGYGKVSAAQEKYASAHTPNVDLENIAGAKAVVSASEANLRSEASAASERVAKLEQGTSLTIESAEQTTDGYWYKVESETDQGYIRADLVAVSETDEEETAQNVTITFTADSKYDSYRTDGLSFPMTMQIAKGSSLSASGFSMPKVKLVNEYLSVYNWVTSDNRICTDETIFNEDTTLQLSVFREGENYSLDWNCGIPHTDANGDTVYHSVTYASGYSRSETIKLGDSLSENLIPSVEFVRKNYRAEGCTDGPLKGKQFAGWQVIDQSGNRVDLKAGMALTSAYIASNADRTIRIYAKWEEAPNTYTVNFYAGTALVETRSIAAGTPLSNFPKYEKDGMRAVSWQVKNADGTFTDVTEDTVVNANMDLYAVLKKLYTVTFMVDGEVRKTVSVVEGTPVGDDWLWLEVDDYYDADWVNKEDETEKYYSWTVINSDLTLVWTVERKTATVKFAILSSPYSSYPSSYEEWNVGMGLPLSEYGKALPEAVKFSGFVFKGWTDDYYGSKKLISLDTVITQEYNEFMPVYVQTHAVTVKVDGTDYAYTVETGNTLGSAVNADGVLLSNFIPTKDGYAFAGWYDGSTPASLDEAVYGDMTITAEFTELVKVHFVSVNPVDATDTLDEIYTVEKGAQLSAAKDASGNPIGENLPEAKTYDGYEFIGWFYKVDDASNGAEASLTQTIAAETYFTANYKKIEACTLTLHDVKPDGTEYTQDGVSSIDILVPAGGKLRDVLAEYELYDGVDASTCIWYTQKGTVKTKLDLDATLTANTDIYTYTYQLKLSVGENSASLKDVLFPTAYAATADVTGGTLTLTAREGEKLKASDFVVNGVDYSLYTMKSKSDNTPISVSDLIANGLTGNIEAVGTPATNAAGTQELTFYVCVDDAWKIVETKSVNVYSYDRSYSDRYGNWKSSTDSKADYYISAATLESIYGEYGFSASDLITNGFTQFPFATSANSTTVYAAPGENTIGEVGSGISYISRAYDWWSDTYTYTAHNAVAVYYMPGGTVTSTSGVDYTQKTYSTTANTFYTITLKDADDATIRTEYGRGKVAKTVELGMGDWTCETHSTITIKNGVATIPADSMTKAYTFKRTTPTAYAITVVDDFQQVYTAAQLNTINAEHQNYPVEIPAENVQITVNAPASADYYWKVFEADGTTEVGSNEYTKTENGEAITFTFAVVNKHYMIKLTADGDVITVKYITNELTAEQCGTSYPASVQTEWPGGRGPSTVQGQDTPYIEQVVVNDRTQYSVKAPDTPAYRSRAAYGEKGDMLFTYRFWGWELTDKDGNAVVLNANDMLDKAKLSQYAVDGTVTLTARYSAKQNASDKRIATASFFVIVNSKLADVGGGSTSTPIGNYSDALYTTAVYGDVNDIALSGSNGQLIYASTGALTATEVDTKIRALTEGYTNNGKTVYLDNLPSDEYCLSRLRTWASRGTAQDITITGSDGKEKIINTEDLTTENFTIRWFVFKYDGTDGWHIDGLLVPKQGKLTIRKTFDGDAAAVAAVKEDFEITVTKSGETAAAHTLNLNAYNADTNASGYTAYDAATDTYTWVVDVDQTQKYTVAENKYEYPNGGMTTSAEYAISNSSGSTSGYRKYTGAVEVTGYAYATDVEYVNYQTVAFRNTYIPSGTLVVRKVDSVTGQAIQGVSFVLKKDGEIVNPLYKADDSYYLYQPEDGVAYETITDGTVTTNASGYFNFVRRHGSTETFTLEEQPLPGYEVIKPITIEAGANGELTVTSEDKAAVYDATTRTVTVTNTAERLKITVKKEWAEGDTKKEVTVHLMYNGNVIQSGEASEEVKLNESNWTHEWTNQPLYVNGKPVTYSIRETWIGDTAYDANADADGYQDYVVTVDPMVYTYEDGTTGSAAIKEDGTEVKYATSGTITVHNATYKGQIVFQKTDEDGKPLEGATFKLYADEDMSGTPRAEATSNGNGQVSFGEMPVGTYYFMKETNSPAGYKDNATKYRVTITSTGTKIEYLDGADWKALIGGAVINEKIKTAEITLLKVNEKGSALSGAAFQLRNAKGENIGAAQKTGADGKITFTGLTPGDYQLVETAAPAGYYKMTATIEFTVNEDGTVNMTNTNDSWSLAGATFTVTNHAGSELPETGGSGTIPYTIGGLLLMAASLLCGLNPRRKRERRCER